jgi:hypothetical protein
LLHTVGCKSKDGKGMKGRRKGERILRLWWIIYGHEAIRLRKHRLNHKGKFRVRMF